MRGGDGGGRSDQPHEKLAEGQKFSDVLRDTITLLAGAANGCASQVAGPNKSAGEALCGTTRIQHHSTTSHKYA